MPTGKKRKNVRADELTSRRADLLFEIGTEELPAAYLGLATEQLRQEARRGFEDAHLPFESLEAFSTPRRLLLVLRGLSGTQHNPPEEIRGPSKQAAYDSAGKPTGALTGFLNAKGGTVSQTKIVPSGKGEYLYLFKPARTAPTAAILPRLLEHLIGRIRFPKTMRWDDSGIRFARPIRWVLALYGTQPLRITVGRLASGKTTRVGGPKRPQAVAITSPDQYLATLERHRIVWDQDKRRSLILEQVTAAAKRQGGQPAQETTAYGLLDEVTFLVEEPIPLLGRFEPKYLSLPREVLLASMAKHQRVFALEGRGGKLLPSFVAVLDGPPRKLAEVRRVHEHILNARLADSLLFWEEDRKRSLDTMKQRLSSVMFHEKLGSMQDKTRRLCSLGNALAPLWQLTSQERDALGEACACSKADLVSTMVKEFPTLQGVMGKYYAGAAGKSSLVAEAIGEQYLPLGGQLPQTKIGCALALLDKYDTLASYFSVGIEPTGDQDPFGLRRAAQGIVEIAWSVHSVLPLEQLFLAWQPLAPFARGKATAAERIRQYVLERLYTFAWPNPTPARDLIDAVLSSPCADPVDAMDRIQHLQQLNGDRALLKAAKVIERTRNILKDAKTTPADVDPARFQEPLERTLWERYTTHKDRIDHLIHGKQYADATKLYSETFFEVLHEFFAKVMVNVNDPAVQQNRLALMRTINALYTDRIADLSKLTILQRGVV